MKTAVAGTATLALLFTFTLSGHTQPGSTGEAGAHRAHASKHYSLPATPENVQWGWYDPGEKPRLVIDSGDTVSIETIPHALGQIKPGLEMTAIVKLRKENDGGGPHSITGPIYAYALVSMVGDCRVTQVVDIRKGVHCMIPKKVFVDYRRSARKGTG